MADIFKTINLDIKTKTEEAKKELSSFTDGFKDYFGKQIDKAFKKSAEDMGFNLAQNINKGVTKGLSKVKDWFVNEFKDAWSEIGNLANASLMTNATTRENVFNYGMSAAQSYGFEQAKSMLGIQNDDELMYMNEFQRNKFTEIMEKYTNRYNELYDSGFFEDYLDYQIEMQEFQQDLRLEFVQWFIDNKDTIKTVLNTIMTVSEFIITALGGLLSLFGAGSSSSSYSDSYVNNTSNVTNNNVKVDYTFNGNGVDQTALSNPGLMTYEQIMSILK